VLNKANAMNKALLLNLLIPALLVLSACGFTPVYSDTTGVQNSLEQIHINTIPNRDGQFLRNRLLDRFYQSYSSGKNKPYVLEVTDLTIRKTDLDITKGADATRAQLRVRAQVALIETKTKNTLISRNITSITSYNILDSQFTTRVSEQTARENALKDMANQIERYVSLHFAR
jgi:LPS-assembly lipoprotein